MIEEHHRESVHLRFCATRNVSASAIFIALCGIMLLVSIRNLNVRQHPEESWFLLAFEAYVLVMLCVFLRDFTCLRERIVLGLAILPFVKALIFRFAPTIGLQLAGLAAWFELADWSAAFVVSVTMFGSAVRAGNARTSSIRH